MCPLWAADSVSVSVSFLLLILFVLFCLILCRNLRRHKNEHGMDGKRERNCAQIRSQWKTETYQSIWTWQKVIRIVGPCVCECDSWSNWMNRRDSKKEKKQHTTDFYRLFCLALLSCLFSVVPLSLRTENYINHMLFPVTATEQKSHRMNEQKKKATYKRNAHKMHTRHIVTIWMIPE